MFNFRKIRNFFFIFFPLVIMICFVCKFYDIKFYWIEWAYAIALSGLVGLGTNSLAIRMLFRPKRPTCFGKWRQGILPRHQNEVADTIGEAAKKEIMNVENIRAYIEQSTLIENAIKEFSDFLTRAVENKNTRDIIHKKIIEIYNEHADFIFEKLVDKTDETIVDFFANNWDADSFWKNIRPQLEKMFDKINVEQELTEKIVAQLVDAAPHIALIIKNEIIKYVSKDESKNPWEWLKFKFANYYVDDDKIKKIIVKYLRRKSFQKRILDYVENNIDNITAFIESRKDMIDSIHNWLKNQTRKIGKDKLIPYAKIKIEFYLNSDDSWESMDSYIHKSMILLIDKIPDFSKDEAVISAIKKAVPELAQGIDVKSLVSEIIKNKDPEDFEKLIRKATDKHLAAIEVLGGFLGMASGLALINKWFVILVPGCLGLFVLIEKTFTKNE